MAKKSKKTVEAPVIKPFRVSLNPLNINQPVSVCQTFETVATAYEEPVVEAPVVHKCSVKRAQRFWGILALLLIAAVAVFALVLAPDFAANMANVWTYVPHGHWKLADWGLFVGLYLGAIICVSILVRWFLHSIGCRAKRRNKRCCRRCEFYKFAWTVIFVGLGSFIGLAYGFAAINFLGFTALYNNVIEVINLLLASGFNLATLSPLHVIGAYVVIAIVVLFVLFVIITLAHKAKDRKRAKYRA